MINDQKTTISVGFKANTQELERANRQVDSLKGKLNDVQRSGGRKKPDGFTKKPDGFTKKPDGFTNTVSIFSGGSIARKGIIGGTAAFGALGLSLATIGLISKAVSGAKEYLQVLDPLTKQLSIVGQGQEKFTEKIRRTGENIGKTRTEMVRLTQAYTQMAGQQDGTTARQMNVAGLFSKGTGIDAGLTTSSMGSMAQMGVFGEYGNMRMERFAVILADAISRGGMKGREGELFSSIQSLMGNQLNVLTRLASGSTDSMTNILTAMNRTEKPGLMGMRGANVLSRMDAGFKNPQGEFGEYFMYNALGGGDYFDFKMRQEQGIFGEGNFSAVSNNLKRNFKDPKARWHVMGKMYGISMHQAQAIDGMEIGDSQALLDAIDRSGGDIRQIGADKFGIMGELFNAETGIQREQLLKDSRIADLAKEKGWTGKTDIEEILQGIAGQDLKQTTNEKMLTELGKVENAITDLGNKALPHLVTIVENTNIFAKRFFDKNSALKNPRTLGEHVERAAHVSLAFRNPLYMLLRGKDLGLWGNKPKPADTETFVGISKTIATGLSKAVDPIAEGFRNLFKELGNINVYVNVNDHKSVGDGNSIKVGGGA